MDSQLTRALATGAVASAEALQAETQARGQARAVAIAAEAEAARTKIAAKGEAEAEVILAKGSAEAEKIKAEGSKSAATRSQWARQMSIAGAAMRMATGSRIPVFSKKYVRKYLKKL